MYTIGLFLAFAWVALLVIIAIKALIEESYY
jgi:hypothetical protein